jgi:hypothetical protein
MLNWEKQVPVFFEMKIKQTSVLAGASYWVYCFNGWINSFPEESARQNYPVY